MLKINFRWEINLNFYLSDLLEYGDFEAIHFTKVPTLKDE